MVGVHVGKAFDENGDSSSEIWTSLPFNPLSIDKRVKNFEETGSTTE